MLNSFDTRTLNKPFDGAQGLLDPTQARELMANLPPEICCGFRPGTADDDAFPLWYALSFDKPDRYRLSLEVQALEDGTTLLFAQQRQFVGARSVVTGQSIRFHFALHTGRIIPRDETSPRDGFTVNLCLIGCRVRLKKLTISTTDMPTLFLMGDSTVTNQNAELPYAPEGCYAGWGQMLPCYLPQNPVCNQAHSGLSTETFRNEGHWDVMSQELRPGDTALMQFGHNDQKVAHLDAFGGYACNLRRFVEELRGRNVSPILVTPLARNSWRDSGEYNDLLHDNAEAVFQVGRELTVPVIDLHAASMGQYLRMGLDGSMVYFHPGDFTHTNDRGAMLAAEYVALQLRRLTTLKQWQAPGRIRKQPDGVRLLSPCI